MNREITIEGLRAAIEVEYARAQEEAVESARDFPNSYGAGFDGGYANALRELIAFLRGSEDTLYEA